MGFTVAHPSTYWPPTYDDVISRKWVSFSHAGSQLHRGGRYNFGGFGKNKGHQFNLEVNFGIQESLPPIEVATILNIQIQQQLHVLGQHQLALGQQMHVLSQEVGIRFVIQSARLMNMTAVRDEAIILPVPNLQGMFFPRFPCPLGRVLTHTVV